MMTAFSKLITVLPIAAFIAGCFTVDIADAPGPEERHIVVSNYGWYLFDSVPLVCGNAAKDPSCPFTILRDDVTLNKIQRRFTDCEKEANAHAFDLVWNTHEQVLFAIPGLEIPFPIPYILCYREIQLSGVMR